ncbi:MAG: hypothetical protein ACM3US_02075 [Sphingomonadaceae bacterium]
MGNRDKRDDKVKKPKKGAKLNSSKLEVTELPPPVEVVRKKRKEPRFDEN